MFFRDKRVGGRDKRPWVMNRVGNLRGFFSPGDIKNEQRLANLRRK